MKVEGDKKLVRQLDRLPQYIQDRLEKTMVRAAKEGVRMARTLVSVDTGEQKSRIFAKFQKLDGEFRASVEAADDTTDQQSKARSIEFGRRDGNRGKTQPVSFIVQTAKILGRKHRARVKSAVNRGAKEAFK